MADGAEDAGRPLPIEVAKSTEIHLDLDDEKIEAIKECLAKGRLSIRVSDVDLSQGGRLEAIYTYD